VSLLVPPQTRYAKLGDVGIAYQVIGDGPPSLIWSSGSSNHTDEQWGDPAAAVFMRRVAGFSRLIRFDVLGTGASDRVPNDVHPPRFAEQLEAVRTATQSDRFALFAANDAGPTAIEYGSANPERVTHLVLFNTTACLRRRPDYPIGVDDETLSSIAEMLEQGWGTEAMAEVLVPSKADDGYFVSWFSKYMRSVGTPAEMRRHMHRFMEIDVRSLLGSITAPTLIMHRANPIIPESHGRHLTDRIENATFVRLPGNGMALYYDDPDLVLAHIEGFITSSSAPSPPEKRLMALLFTDIVESTARLERLGDRDWSTVLEMHDEISARHSARYGGSVVKSTGDGILAIFTNPADAVRAAQAIRDELARMSVEIRSGIHCGEVQQTDHDLVGIAVHITARVMSHAEPGEILVTRTVRDLTAGSINGLTDAGTHELKGVTEPWQLYKVDPAGSRAGLKPS
jgi:class 3 adenylate cyclase/pimeloyl-ACP methyl ester carboxylesterase